MCVSTRTILVFRPEFVSACGPPKKMKNLMCVILSEGGLLLTAGVEEPALSAAEGTPLLCNPLVSISRTLFLDRDALDVL
jgi:hypothetical protein